ncbi:LOW QUALITY PROTEIN: putative Transmembrane amino acid transporter protein/Tryptophan/tyrosine permease family [Leishmania utingensis]|uniref:Transmembrane amino acid transporter protein/Tryptophan/tyrosine permease family n=1 Tax=Leishmania utingensis TaxID=653362 RepID=A0AAW3A6F9_9TRYP
MTSRETSSSYKGSAQLPGRQAPEKTQDLRSEFDVEVTQGYVGEDVKGMEDISSTEVQDPYDFSRHDPKNRIEMQDRVRADRVARRRMPANKLQKYLNYVVPYGGLLSTGLNLASSSIGAGIIALPYAFNSSGLVMAIFYMRADRVARRRMPANKLQKYLNYVVPYGGLLSTGLNLASSSIGAGIIALPYAFNSSGLVMAIFYMIVVAYLTIYSYYLLGQAGTRTGLRNYEQIVRTLLGPGADYFLAFCMWFLSFGGEVSYVISAKDVLTAFLENADSTPAFLLGIWGQRLLTFILWLVAMLPLCLPKEINSLRYFSCIAIVFIVYFVIAMVVHSVQNGLRADPRPEIRLFNTGNTAIAGLATFMFAFVSQLNAYESYGEMKSPTPLRLTLGASIAVGIVFVLYLFAGLFGYLDFGPMVIGSALRHYNPIEDKMMGVGYAGILFKLCVGYGLHMIPVRDAIYHCIRVDVHTLEWWKNACVCGSMAVLSLVAGLFLPNVKVAFGLVGGFSGGFIGFIYPALMVMYAGSWSLSSVGWYHYLSTYLLLIVGVIGVVWGTASSIYGEI